MIILMMSAEIVCAKSSPRHIPGCGAPIRERLKAAGFRYDPGGQWWVGGLAEARALEAELQDQLDSLRVEVGRIDRATNRRDKLKLHSGMVASALEILRDEIAMETA